jgi:glyoxylase-like metal-dependent hydrolase (beta-lactamase superfamily II)
MKYLLLLSLSAVNIGCSSAPLLPDARMTLERGDSRVGEYVSSWKGFRTSSYWIEGPRGVIVIDTQFLSTAAEEMLAWVENKTRKNVVLAIVLHPNPDKFNGTAVFQKRGIRVVTSEQVKALIPSVHTLRKKWFYDRFKPDYPEHAPVLESFGTQTTTLEAGGIQVKAHVLGPGCSATHVVVEFDGHVFVGDLVTRGFHAWLELGQLPEWRKRLEEIEAMEPKFVHTGRGGTGDSDTLERQSFYLDEVMRLIRAEIRRSGRKPTEAGLETLQEKILERFPGLDYPTFAERGLALAWERLAK